VRNSSRTMRRAWVLPTRSLAWAREPIVREAIGSRPGIWFWFDQHRTDRFRPALQTHYWGASVLFVEVKWQRRHRRKLSFTMKKYPPCLPARVGGEFPGKGELCLRATLSDWTSGRGDGAYLIHLSSTLGVNIFIVAATGLPAEAAATAASCSNSSGVRYPNAEWSRCRL